MEILSRKKSKSNKNSNILFIVSMLIMFLIVAISCSRCNQWLGLKDDNIVEELTECAIEKNIGLEIDLTPNSPE